MYKVEVGFSDKKELGGENTTLRHTYWDSLFTSLQPFLFSQEPSFHQVNRENGFPYQEFPKPNLGQNTIFIGYFQSYRYFQDKFQDIIELLQLSKKRYQVLGKVLQISTFHPSSISMHFRLGDYKKFPLYHPILPKEYYRDALLAIGVIGGTSVLYFCEDEDVEDVQKTIDWLKNDFDLKFQRAPASLEDWEQLLFMSCCRHHIIANSSFSWWGAWLADSRDQVVIAPANCPYTPNIPSRWHLID